MRTHLWTDILERIQRSVDSHRYETWFRPLVPIQSADPNELTLGAHNQFIADFLDQHYSTTILTLAKQFHPSIYKVSFTVIQNIQQKASSSPPSAPPANSDEQPEFEKLRNLNPLYTFQQFVVGPGNQFAKSASSAVAEAPGKTKFNPLLIYGGVGLGKTHLLHAIGNHAKNLAPTTRVAYASSEDFYFSFIDAIKNNETKQFAEQFASKDILLMDDIQFLAGKESTQEEFFYIFNILHQNGRQIVLTSDLPPARLQGLQDRLVSRFQWGLAVDIQPPDLETRVAILKKKAEKDKLSISEEVLYFIAENVPSNIRELEGIIIKVLAYASITRTDISIPLVRNILQLSSQEQRSKVSIEEIIDYVASYYKVPVDNLRERNRRKEVAHSRHVAMYIAKNLTNHSLKTIGLHFGGRDHSTVIHAVKHVQTIMEKDEDLRNEINYIIAHLSS
ncbi:MAG: chromosomal replication initiator protein DnaA [Chitinivibrionales bacterium]|nr:chromosomal replication initiator protein DnaA [Chitinivibrionales bacterium]